MYFLGDQFSENKAKILSGTCHFLCLRFLNIDFVQTLDPSGGNGAYWIFIFNVQAVGT